MYVVIGCILFLWWFCCRNQPTGRNLMFGRTIPPFYQMSAGICQLFFRYAEDWEYMDRLSRRLDMLYPGRKGKSLAREFLCYKGSLVLTIFVAAMMLSIALLSVEREEQAVTGIEREEYWGEEKEENLTIQAEGVQQQDIVVMVPERKYDQEELASILEKMAQSLPDTILGENSSLDCVTKDLNLVQAIPDTKVTVSWDMDTDRYMEMSGALIPGAVTEAGAVVNLTATLSYEKASVQYQFAVHLQQPVLTEEEQWVDRLRKEIELRNASYAAAQVLELPDQVDGKEVRYVYKGESYGYKVFGMMSICGLLVFFLKDEKLQKEVERRNRQMLVDYSEVVSKLTLLLGAGMTIRGALEKMAADYVRKKGETGGERYAYEEIVYICREMQGGISERNGIEMLGVRCGIPCYMKLSSILMQNLKKGSRGMAESLGYEVGLAFEERKNAARRMGEEAGTKLLFPMILMLVIVMAVLVIPAFLSF